MEPRQDLCGSIGRDQYAYLKFTHKYEPHLIDLDDDDHMGKVNLKVLMSLTTFFDDMIHDASQDIEIEMPFGRWSLMKHVLDWIVYDCFDDQEDFALLQGCVEFCRFYRIPVPEHPDVDIIQTKVDLDDSIPYGPRVSSETETSGGGDDLPSIDLIEAHTVLEIGGKVYQRKWKNRDKTGWYYKCRCKGCPGSIFLRDGVTRVVREHDPEVCVPNEQNLDVSEWKEIEELIRSCVSTHPRNSAFDVLTECMRTDCSLTKTLLRAPLRTVLKYITLLLREGVDDTSLEETLTRSSGIEDSSLLYQQVVPSKIVIYGLQRLRKYAQDTQWLLIDGTFHACPKHFYQCVTLLSRHEATGVFFPLCHCLLPDKSSETYDLMFDVITTNFSFPGLCWITVDFEWALIQSVKRWVKGNRRVRVIGCKFHFSKALNRRFRGTKRRKLSQPDQEFLTLFQQLPFMNKEDITRVLHGLATVQHAHDDFVAYVQKHWMRDEMFTLWNLDGIEDDGLLSRYTNNGIEAFHSIMKRQLNAHPRIQGFLHWAEMHAEEKDKIISVGNAPNTCARDHDGLVIEQMELRFRWEQLIRIYPCKPQFQVLSFGFTCPECSRRNLLTGRRTSHLYCENEQCKFSKEMLPSSLVLEQVVASISEGLEQLPGKISRRNALNNMKFWLKTLCVDSATENEMQYLIPLWYHIEDTLQSYDRQSAVTPPTLHNPS